MNSSHIPCEHCGSSDGATDYGDHIYCFVCRRTTRKGEQPMFENLEYRDLPKRGLRQDTCRKYGYGVTTDKQGNLVHVAQYQDEAGVVFQKVRTQDKQFYVLGKQKQIFFGQHLFNSGKKLVVTEGEIDCLTVSQVNDNKYPVVSIPCGAQSAKRVFQEQLQWLEKFEEVIVMFDNDSAGYKAINSIIGLLSPHKLKIASLPLKDANECLLANRTSEIISAIWNAKEYRPQSIVYPQELMDDYLTYLQSPQRSSYQYPLPEGLNTKTQGLRKGEMCLITAGTGIGKTTYVKEVALKLLQQDNLHIGLMMLEENKYKTITDLLSIKLQTPLHMVSKDFLDTDSLKTTYESIFSDNKLCIYDHFGSLESEDLLSMIRYMVVSEECDFIVLDHITIALANEKDISNERQAIDILMTKLRALVEELQFGLIIISHLRKTGINSKSFETGGVISLDDLRGSGSLKQLPDTIISLERNQQAETNSDSTLVRVLKCRYTGDTGIAGFIAFDKNKHTFHEKQEGDKADGFSEQF